MNAITTATSFAAEIRGLEKRPCIVADRALHDFAAQLAEELECPFLLLPSGEVCKTRAEKERIEDFLLQQGFGRDAVLIALGGGSTGDLVGFTASTYCRGVSFINIPTTLLAMVDACFGGKTAINTPLGKNMLGSLWPASLTLIEPRFLATLPDHEIACGAMEMVKHGLIADRGHFERLLKSPLTDISLINESLDIKKEICKKDPAEQAERFLLNFGHTVGHAIESYFNYEISHGMAVGIGLKVESYISYLHGWLGETAFQDICQAIDFLGKFPPLGKMDKEALIELMRRDKKSLRGSIRMSALEDIGRPKDFQGAFCTVFEEKAVREGLSLLDDVSLGGREGRQAFP